MGAYTAVYTEPNKEPNTDPDTDLDTDQDTDPDTDPNADFTALLAYFVVLVPQYIQYTRILGANTAVFSQPNTEPNTDPDTDLDTDQDTDPDTDPNAGFTALSARFVVLVLQHKERSLSNT